MIKVYRVLLAVDYKDGRQRELFYTENKERAELKFKKDCKTVQRIADDNGMKIYDITHSDTYHTFSASPDGDKIVARAELRVRDDCEGNFMDFYNDPLF